MHVASVSASSGAGTSDRAQTFRRLWNRVHLAAERTRLEYVFLAIALAWGVMQVFIVFPLQAPSRIRSQPRTARAVAAVARG